MFCWVAVASDVSWPVEVVVSLLQLFLLTGCSGLRRVVASGGGI